MNLLLLTNLIIISAVCSIYALPTTRDLKSWESFKLSHNKKYATPTEELQRQTIFLNNLRRVEENKDKFEKGLVSYTIGINKFSDLTPEELYPYTHGVKVPTNTPSANSTHVVVPRDNPSEFDWRDRGIVPAVKDQASCGSCWAFSAVGAIETHYRLYLDQEVSLSEQQLVDCVITNAGCGGGWMDYAFAYIHQNGGIETESDYPYEHEDRDCRDSSSRNHYSLNGFTDIAYGNENALLDAVVQIGPIAIAFDASGDFGYYEGGVYYNPDCKVDYLTHAVLAIGYGTENGQDYWLMRNSWGQDWGDNGYFKIARNRNNHCGIVSAASYPIVN